MKRLFKITFISAALTLFFASCVKDLNTTPIDPNDMTSANVYTSLAGYKQVLAKLYAGLSVTGQQGPAGNPDITTIDEGFSQYLRAFWYLQEFPTDEAVTSWGDPGIKDFHSQNWSADNKFIGGMYYRVSYQITLCNAYLRESTDSKLSERGISDADRAEIARFTAETRFLRALSYSHAIDFFGSVPFVTEADAIGKFFPTQNSRANIFAWIEGELLTIEPLMMAPKTNEYGRADQAAVWMLLAKLYLNAEVYAGQGRYADCITYCNKLMNAGYSLETKYNNLFLADNNNCKNEIIFPIEFDGDKTKTWGGTTFIICGAVGGSMNDSLSLFGISNSWAGTRTTSALVTKFDTILDKRAMFWSYGQSLEIADIGKFTDGYAITKFRNVTSTGDSVHDKTKTFCDTDFPLFRLADVYLMYAEAVLRGGGGDQAIALDMVNQLRTRAYGNTGGNITAGELNLDFILNERARELYWEGCRRTDLIRYGRFSSGNYLWPWKGGAASGIPTDVKYNLFPIPSSDISANPNLTQNTGY